MVERYFSRGNQVFTTKIKEGSRVHEEETSAKDAIGDHLKNVGKSVGPGIRDGCPEGS